MVHLHKKLKALTYKPGAKERETLSISVDSQLVKMWFAKFV